jgi:N-acetylneuraminate synthase
MIPPVKIGEHLVGPENPCYIVAEIGINHNGDLDLAKKLIEVAADVGCHAVKFQKRTIDIVYTAEELARPRESVFGETYGDLKRALEFGHSEFQEIGRKSVEAGIAWFASCWDEASIEFVEQFNPPCYKIASASLTDDNLLREHRKCDRPIILSTGMSTIEQIDHAVEVLGTHDLVILHCTSSYPAKESELNLSLIPKLAERYGVPIGYSGHEVGLATSLAAVVYGACMLERHITSDRALWGSDQAASVEPQGFQRLIRDIRAVESASGDGIKRVHESEIPIMNKLRRKS